MFCSNTNVRLLARKHSRNGNWKLDFFVAFLGAMSNFITGLIWSKQPLPRCGFLFAWFPNEKPGWGGILNGRSSDFFSDEQFVKTPVMAIKDSAIHSEWHFKSHLLGNGTMSHMTYDWVMSQWMYFCDNYMAFWCQATNFFLDKYLYMTWKWHILDVNESCHA